MQYRKEILRGVRMAAVAFAVLLVVLISYRMLHGAPSESSRSEAAPVDHAEAAPSKPAFAPAPAANFEVPAPPPPSSAKPGRVRKAMPSSTRIADAQPLPRIMNADPAPIVPPAAPELPPVIAAAPPVVVPEPVAVETATTAPTAPQPVPPAPAVRKRGVVHAVGRFLHLVKRNDTASANSMTQTDQSNPQ